MALGSLCREGSRANLSVNLAVLPRDGLSVETGSGARLPGRREVLGALQARRKLWGDGCICVLVCPCVRTYQISTWCLLLCITYT